MRFSISHKLLAFILVITNSKILAMSPLELPSQKSNSTQYSQVVTPSRSEHVINIDAHPNNASASKIVIPAVISVTLLVTGGVMMLVCLDEEKCIKVGQAGEIVSFTGLGLLTWTAVACNLYCER